MKNRDWFLLISFFSILFVYFLTPNEIFNLLPATGGDTGSHFYPLYALFKAGWPEFRLRVWNPGNLFGEPLLLHYFPGPFIVMSILGTFLPLGLAFNIGTILPLFIFPISVFAAFWFANSGWKISLLALAASLLYVFNESHSMLGGNSNSLLAGQFAHMYGLCFLFFTLARLHWELQNGKKYFVSSLLISAVAICHSYIFLLIPFFFLSILITEDSVGIKKRFHHLLYSGLYGFGISLWFVIPQALNSKWQTATPMTWVFNDFWKEVIPVSYRPLLYAMLLLIPMISFGLGRRFLSTSAFMKEFIYWLIPLLACGFMYLIFPKLGLVDARVVPQAQLFLALLIFTWIGQSLEVFPDKVQTICVMIIVGVTLWWTQKNIVNYPHWVRWNYSGWQSKKLTSQAAELHNYLKGSFSDPRVIGEHHEILDQAGTIRLFEMLPYFSGRGTMESLYDQAIHTSSLGFFLQAKVSVHPSCPIRGIVCPSVNFTDVTPKLDVLGIRDIILVSDEAKQKMSEASMFHSVFEAGVFKVYRWSESVPLVETLKVPPQFLESDSDYKNIFYKWFTDYDGTQPHKIVAAASEIDFTKVLDEQQSCHPVVQAEFNRITLHTDCPGKIHYLKFAYHPSFQSLTGERIFLMTPGFMGIVPKANDVVLEFGHSWIWIFSTILSIAFLASMILIGRRKR